MTQRYDHGLLCTASNLLPVKHVNDDEPLNERQQNADLKALLRALTQNNKQHLHVTDCERMNNA